MAEVLSHTEQKVILKGVSWETYERLFTEHEESREKSRPDWNGIKLRSNTHGLLYAWRAARREERNMAEP